MQFNTFVSSFAAAGALLASEAAAQQTTMSSSMAMMSGQKMTVMPSMTMEKGMQMPGAAKPTGSPMKPGMKGGEMKKGMVHKVMVSDDKGTLKFTPSSVEAPVGHMVEFMFHPNNHSVAQAAFDKPCMPMDMAMPGMTGFYSGFMPSSKTDAEVKTFTVMVNSTEPMWFYCSQAKHCQNGMVGVINPPANNAMQNLEMFMMGAKNATMNMSPSKVAGGMEKMQMKGNAKASGKAHKSGSMGTGKMGMGMAKGTGKMGLPKGMKTSSAMMAMGTGSMTETMMMVTSAPLAANAVPTPAAAQAAGATTSIKQGNGASGIATGSPLSLLAMLAAAFFIYA